MRWVVLLVLLGCGRPETELCQRLSAWNAEAHRGSCTYLYLPANSVTQDACMAAMPGCSEDDFLGLQLYADCRDALPVCADANAYISELAECDQIGLVRVRFQCWQGMAH